MNLDFYFNRFGFCGEQLSDPPPAALGLVVVIPAHDEPNLVGSLDALWNCQRPLRPVEVIVVINSSEDANHGILARNLASLASAQAWASAHRDPGLAFRIIHAPILPRKHAGVGLARKIGMDEALRRFARAGSPPGVLACFDADCTCDPNYLVEIERFFAEHPAAPACSIYFEHPLSGPEPDPIYEAIALYELHLRYYVQGLRYAGFPHAFHTVGSSMAVRASVYAAQGGMNRRQAGEDFYFLHKIIPLGGFGEINDTRVIPSPRPSHRVPFGTGKAVGEYLAGRQASTYPLQAFEDLRALFGQAPRLRASHPVNLAPPLVDFLQQQEFDPALDELRANAASEASFVARFFRWFDAFRAMKYIHFARNQTYGAAGVLEAAASLLQREELLAAGRSAADLLQAYRHLQRRGWTQKSTGPTIDPVLAAELEF
jgi:hypothetical protein